MTVIWLAVAAAPGVPGAPGAPGVPATPGDPAWPGACTARSSASVSKTKPVQSLTYVSAQPPPAATSLNQASRMRAADPTARAQLHSVHQASLRCRQPTSAAAPGAWAPVDGAWAALLGDWAALVGA